MSKFVFVFLFFLTTKEWIKNLGLCFIIRTKKNKGKTREWLRPFDSGEKSVLFVHFFLHYHTLRSKCFCFLIHLILRYYFLLFYNSNTSIEKKHLAILHPFYPCPVCFTSKIKRTTFNNPAFWIEYQSRSPLPLPPKPDSLFIFRLIWILHLGLVVSCQSYIPSSKTKGRNRI